MNKELEALEKLNHTICLNNCEETLKFGIDDDEHIDCNNVYEFVDCYNTIKSALKRKEKLEKAFHTLSKEDEKAKKLLSLEIEKNRKLQIIEEKFEKVWEIIKKHKLLNYVLKNKKCADMYKLTDEEIDLLKELEK